MTLPFPKKTLKSWDSSEIIDAGLEKNCVYKTSLGVLYEGDCMKLLPFIYNETIDTIFADPPFNLAKEYGLKVNDSRSNKDYIEWCKKWIIECMRILKPGGAFFLYNLPKWNVILGNYLVETVLEFRHWITINIKLVIPKAGRGK